MAEVGDNIDFKALEKELLSAIEEDTRYWQQNDAKIRAVNQRVSTYDEFKEIVNAAHLKPLDKSEALQPDSNVPHGCIWNTIASKKRVSPQNNFLEPNMESNEKNSEEEINQVCSSSAANIVQELRSTSDTSKKYAILRNSGPDVLKIAFKTEIPVGVFGEIIEALLEFPVTTSDIVIVSRILQVLSQTKRFNVSLAFLSSVEKRQCKLLIEKLSNSLNNRQQDLAEQGVTEWTVSTLKSQFQL